LQQCQDETPALQAVEPLTLRASLKSLELKLWDEKGQKIIGFGELKALARRG
jgi:omega-6 fatty acid desaturase (delta-12 desaturase)